MVKGALQPATFAGMAELADATDLKSVSTKLECRFDPGYRQKKMQLTVVSCIFLSDLIPVPNSLPELISINIM